MRADRGLWALALAACVVPAIGPPSHFAPEPPGISQSRPGLAVAWAPLAVTSLDVVSPLGTKAAFDAGFQATSSSWSARAGLWGRGISFPDAVGAIRVGGGIGGGGLLPWYPMWGVTTASAELCGQLGWLEDGEIRSRGAVGVEAVIPFERVLVEHLGSIEGSAPLVVYSVPTLWFRLDAAHTFPLGRDSGFELGWALHLGVLPDNFLPIPTVALGARL